MNNYKEKDLKLALDVASKTIGLELTPVTPMSTEETKEWIKKHTKEYAEPEYYKGKKPYILKPEEREIVKRLLHTDDKGLDKLTISINDEGKIIARTPQLSWMTLCGREWVIDLKTQTHELVALN